MPSWPDPTEFDHHAPIAREDALAFWAHLRDLPGLARTERYGGVHLAARHADLCAAAADFATFSSAQGVALPAEDRSPHIPEEVDPPLQRAYRRILEPALSRGPIEQAAPMVRRHARTLFDSVPVGVPIDFVDRVARPFPVQLSLELFGFPTADAGVLFRMVDDLIVYRGHERGRNAGADLARYIEVLLERKAADGGAPGDAVSAIARGEVDGRPLTMDEKGSMARLLLFGGFTTVMLALSWTALHVSRTPGLLGALRRNPAWLDTAADEIVRAATPAAYLRRVATRDSELGGSRIAAGDQLLLCFAAANHDERVFEQPDAVRLDRNPNPHVGFGFGAHRCVGVHFAKLQLRTALDEMAQRYDRFERVGDDIGWSTGETQGVVRLPVILHPREGNPGGAS